MVKGKLKELLSKKLDEEKLNLVPSSYDIVGDILIFISFPEELVKYEKFIAKCFLEFHKNIKVIAKKTGIYSGKFRTPVLKIIAGEKRKDTIHKENDVRISLDVEQVYFSPRSSNERLRISSLVKKDEDVLVMFSGSGAFPLVISKKTDARSISGVEINPTAHEYAKKNLKLNKKKNITLFKGDVDDISQEPILGLKCNWREDHLKAKPISRLKLVEVYLSKGDLENNYEKVCKTLEKLKQKDLIITIHQPSEYKRNELSICSTEKDVTKTSLECYDILEGLCKRYSLLGFITHPYDLEISDADEKKFISFLKNNKYKYIFIENLRLGPFSTPKQITELSKKYKFKVCLDVAHLYVSCSTLEEFYDAFENLDKDNTYYHLADAKDLGSGRDLPINEHSLQLGKGEINYEKIIPYVKRGITEVTNKDELNPVEMVSSWKGMLKIASKKYDRVLMPLPKGAENFLSVALSKIKKGGIIHFYDFLQEKEFDLAYEKIKKACKKAKRQYKILDLVKCGQYAPYTYRICVDFKVLD